MNENKTNFKLSFVSADGSNLLTEIYKEIKDAYGRIAEFAAFQRLVPEEIDPKLYRLRGYDGGIKVLAMIIPIDIVSDLC